MRKFFFPAITLVCMVFAGCTTILESIPGIYKIDVQQGNIIDKETVDQLRPNMNKRQVLFIMGTPMLRDVFHQKRWDYIYSEQLGGEARVQKRLSLYFEGDTLTGVQGDFRPSSLPVLKPSNEVTIELPERSVEKTFSEKIVDMFSFGGPEPAIRPEKSAIEIQDVDGEFIDDLDSGKPMPLASDPDTMTQEQVMETNVEISDDTEQAAEKVETEE